MCCVFDTLVLSFALLLAFFAVVSLLLLKIAPFLLSDNDLSPFPLLLVYPPTYLPNQSAYPRPSVV